MTMPFEDEISDATAAWDVWIGIASTLSGGTSTTANVQTWLNKWKFREDESGPLDVDFSTAFRDRGVTFLVDGGFITNVAGTLTPLHLTLDGAPRALQRVPGDDESLELNGDATVAERTFTLPTSH